ncbi:MAG TPA: thioesterase family protein [Pseudonocardiaceae bacterium]
MSFAAATAVKADGDGRHLAELSPDWAVGERPHGGYLLAVVARAALDAASHAPHPAPDPLAVSAQFLRPPAFGPAVVRTAVRRSGRTVTIVGATLEQDDAVCVEATVTCGTLPDGDPDWLDVPDLAAEPPATAMDVAGLPGNPLRIAGVADLRLDPATFGPVAGQAGLPPHIHLWLRPRDAEPDALFALVAGDISPPVVFNLGRFGWSPTVQLTALLRARPAPGWLRVRADSRSLHDRWFDEDHTVIDSAGRLVCQSRQLAIAPAPSAG